MTQWNFLPQTIASLRVDLQRVEYIGGSAGNGLAVDAIRCVLLIRLAVMEAAQAILQSLTPAAFVAANIVALIAALSPEALEALEEATQSVPRQKLD
jgi:hypothetical protein